MKLIQSFNSPNFNSRQGDQKVIFLILHYTAMKSCEEAIEHMCNKNNKVSSHFLISKKGEIHTYDKHHLFKEEKRMTKGEGRLIVEIEGWKICPLICYDLRFPVFSRNDVDYDVLIYLASWPINRIDAWDTLLKARAIENQCYTIGVNRVGEDGNGFHFNGNSAVFNSFGEKVLSSIENKEEVYTKLYNSYIFPAANAYRNRQKHDTFNLYKKGIQFAFKCIDSKSSI